MKKGIIICILMSLAFTGFAQSSANRKNKLPSKKEFKIQYELFLENESYSDHWSQTWNYEKSKEAVAQELKDFDAYLTAQKSNYEIELLDFIVKTYIYNLDEISYDEVVEYGEALKQKYPKEYRTWWIMGRFYSGSNLNNIFPEFETACQMRGGLAKKDEWVAYFLWDYIYACHMAGMKIHAREGLHYYCQYTNTQSEDHYLYSILYSNQSASSLDQNYELYDTWLFGEDGTNVKVFSTLLGVSIPVHADWTMNGIGYQDGRSYIAISSDPITISETAQTYVTLSIFAFIGIDRNELDRMANASMTKNDGIICEKKNVNLNEIIATRYVYENPNYYTDERNGMKGITYLFSVPYNEFSGISFEHPVDYSKTDASGQTEDGMSYWAMKPHYNRLESTIYFLVNLDACNACFDEAEAWMDSILQGCIFE